MLNARSTVCTIAGVFTIAAATPSPAQRYPDKPIRVLCSEAGGNNDIAARLVTQGIAARLGQPLIVDNRPNGVIAPDIVAKAAPNGYTLLVYNNGFWLGPLVQKSPYDPVKDFAPVSLIAVAPSIFVVPPTVPAKSIKELIALAKSRPGELNYASTGPGSSSYLAAELFKAMAGVDLLSVPYKGAALAINDLIADRVQLMIPPATATLPHVKSGRLRALAVTGTEPSALYPGVPTVAASGLPGYEMAARTGIFAPARTPAAIISRINQEVARFLNTAEAKERFSALGVEAASSTPEEFGNMVKSEIAKIAKVVKSASIQAQ